METTEEDGGEEGRGAENNVCHTKKKQLKRQEREREIENLRKAK